MPKPFWQEKLNNETMKTVAEILKEARKKQGKTLETISQKIKIPLATLEAIENDDYRKLPSATFVKGLIRNYAQELVLDPEKILAVFRRDHQVTPKEGKIIKAKTIVEEGFFWSPRLTVITLTVLALTLVLGFFIFQLRSYFFIPSLTVDSPKEGEVIKSSTFEVKGKTIPDATLSVNEELVSLEFDGSFSYSLKLLPGENIIKIKAVNRRGKTNEVERKVIVDKED